MFSMFKILSRHCAVTTVLAVAGSLVDATPVHADEGRWRFGGRVGAPVTTDATYYYTCSAPFGSKVCSGSSFSIDSVDFKGDHGPIVEGFALARVGGNFYLGLTLGYHASNAFTNKLTGKSIEVGADVSIAPTLEWSPAINEKMSLAFGARVGAFAVLPDGDMGNEVLDMQSACSDLRGLGLGCVVEDGPVWDAQLSLSGGLRYHLQSIVLRADVVFQTQSAGDMVSMKAGSGSTDYEFSHTLNQWSRTLVMVGADL